MKYYRPPFWVSILLCLIAGIPFSLEAMTVQEYQSLDPAHRTNVMYRMAVDEPEKAGNEILPVLEAGLSDTEVDARRGAVAALVRIAWATKAARDQGVPVTPNLSSLETLYGTLRNHLSDPDEEVRGLALVTMFFGYQNSSDFYELLIQRFSEETPEIRAGIIEILAEDKYESDEVKELIMLGLQSDHFKLREESVKATKKIKIPEALPFLAEGLRSPDPIMRQRYLSALATYGKDAAPYLSDLEQLSATELDKYDRTTLQMLIEEIRETTNKSHH